jgi:4-aminobutyrate aminotransferase-like enzyme
MFGISQWGVEPEIMTMAKGIANGMPLAVAIATPEIADAYKTLKISPFGGHPRSCAAAYATSDVIEKENWVDRADELGSRLRAGLEELQRRHSKKVGDVRGKGLMQAIELVVDEAGGDRTPDPAATNRFLEETKQRGLLVGKGGLAGNALRISPPLTVSETEIDDALAIFGEALGAIEK